jgi:hypothetical protein
MATKIYNTHTVQLLDGQKILLMPLKVKYLREFMLYFENVKTAEDDDEAMGALAQCVAVSMKQYKPEIATLEQVEDLCDIETIYAIIEIAADIKMRQAPEEDEKPVAKQAAEGGGWDEFDLAKLESELFLLGIWKDYDELELSLSIPEITATLEAKRDNDYQDKKFAAAIQGVDLDENSGKNNEWEEMKARVFSGGATSDPNDILTFQGTKGAQAGLGLGNGISYEKWD